MGFPLNVPLITRRFGNQLLIVDYRAKLKCAKCGSKHVEINLVSNMDRPDLDHSLPVHYSDDLATGCIIKDRGYVLPFAGYVSWAYDLLPQLTATAVGASVLHLIV